MIELVRVRTQRRLKWRRAGQVFPNETYQLKVKFELFAQLRWQAEVHCVAFTNVIAFSTWLFSSLQIFRTLRCMCVYVVVFFLNAKNSDEFINAGYKWIECVSFNFWLFHKWFFNVLFFYTAFKQIFRRINLGSSTECIQYVPYTLYTHILGPDNAIVHSTMSRYFFENFGPIDILWPKITVVDCRR